MKTKLFLTTFLMAFLMCFSHQSHAQKAFNDTMLVFNNFDKLITWGGDVATFNTGVVMEIFPSRSIMKTISAPMAKKLVLPRAVKTSDGPIVLRHNGTCYQFACDPEAGCGDNCKMAWLDRNGDGKVQPRKELRCVCKPGEVCKMRVTKVRCR